MCTAKIYYVFYPPDPLDMPPDIRQLLRRMASIARDKWRLVGIELGIEVEQLDLISMEGNPIVCFSKVFSQWKKKADTDVPFTWRTIANALRSPIVGESSLATEIEESLRASQ